MAKAAATRQVLCPIDFSEPSRKALRYAAAFAVHANAALTVLYVNDPLLSTAAAAAGYDERKLAAQTDRELRRFVASTLPSRGIRPPMRFATRLGDPRRAIVRAAREHGVGVIVMGTHGLRGAQKMLLGSTTEHTLRTTTVPVLAVPHHAPHRPRRGWPTGPLMAGIDLGPSARADVRAAAAVARLLDTDLLLVHAIGELRAPAWFRRRGPHENEEELARARGRLASVAAEAAETDVAVSFRVIRGDAAASLARTARLRHAGTLVLVLRKAKGLFGMARGTVTYRVLTTASTPVLALPADGSVRRLLKMWV